MNLLELSQNIRDIGMRSMPVIISVQFVGTPNAGRKASSLNKKRATTVAAVMASIGAMVPSTDRLP